MTWLLSRLRIVLKKRLSQSRDDVKARGHDWDVADVMEAVDDAHAEDEEQDADDEGRLGPNPEGG